MAPLLGGDGLGAPAWKRLEVVSRPISEILVFKNLRHVKPSNFLGQSF